MIFTHRQIILGVIMVNNKKESDFDSPIVKGGCFFVLALILLAFVIGSCEKRNDNPYAEAERMEQQIEAETGLKTTIYPTSDGKYRMHIGR